MSKYTTELRNICENYAGNIFSAGYTAIDEIVSVATPKIFDFDFPIFDETYRETLCKKIILHYYTREIGFETVGLWKLKLKTKMNEIMPYYNNLYNLRVQDKNLFNNVDITKVYTKDNTGDGTSRNMYSDTPQGSLQNVDNETYLTNASKNISNAKSNEQYSETVTGLNGSYTYIELINQYRKYFEDIDMMIINDLGDLFMRLW